LIVEDRKPGRRFDGLKALSEVEGLLHPRYGFGFWMLEFEVSVKTRRL
jgi:hypothetical protein